MTLALALEKMVLFNSWYIQGQAKKLTRKWSVCRLLDRSDQYRVIGMALSKRCTTREGNDYRWVYSYDHMIACYKDGLVVVNDNLLWELPRANRRELRRVLEDCCIVIESNQDREDNKSIYKLKPVSPELARGDNLGFESYLETYQETTL